MPDILLQAYAGLRDALVAIAIPLPIFAALAYAVKGKAAFAAARHAFAESRINLALYLTDAFAMAPWMLLMTTAMQDFVTLHHIALLPTNVWQGLHPAFVGLAAVFVGDFTGYWRHRLEHSPPLWPAHAIHHSDTAMTWLSTLRFHPINRLSTTFIDWGVLLLFGFPAYALVVNAVVRHYYGAFIHADLPWTYGPLGRVFVSPQMHRWHHSTEREAYDTNFATVFAIFDRAFGTFRLPGLCDTPLGVTENTGAGYAGKMLHPFRLSAYAAFARRMRRPIFNGTERI